MDKIKDIVKNTSKDDKEKEFSTQPIDDKKSFDPKTAHHNAAPGPAIPKDFSAQEEGTKEERRAKAAAMNQPSDQ
ncbi:hypothetical protein F5X68DRAFT_266216 [Plectosphaerella plurivora]|uniref:Uncharacterized protein n=1 Tax=Plectosphaerella plurivora TaxID=936078 RepID=A0A9P8V0A3_9PEZI|nr:hypothetical protein F5X68DRAFT_266216 [Plectosphaerella plurivora]